MWHPVYVAMLQFLPIPILSWPPACISSLLESTRANYFLSFVLGNRHLIDNLLSTTIRTFNIATIIQAREIAKWKKARDPACSPDCGLKRPEELPARWRVATPLFHREAEFVKVGKRRRRRRHCTPLSSAYWTWLRICAVINK